MQEPRLKFPMNNDDITKKWWFWVLFVTASILLLALSLWFDRLYTLWIISW